MNKTAITINVAARIMLENGFEELEVVLTLNALNQPCEGYVYADEVTNLSIK